MQESPPFFFTSYELTPDGTGALIFSGSATPSSLSKTNSFVPPAKMALFSLLENFSAFPLATAVVLGFFMLLLIRRILVSKRRGSNLPPAVPGSLPLLGNLLQLEAKKPHKTFARWAEIYGPIYSIKTGASSMVVLNSAELAKEAMVTKYPSISTRKLSKALTLLTDNKSMVAMSDYGEFHKMVKRYILTSVLGANAQALGKDIEGSVYIQGLGTMLSKQEIFDVLVVDPMMGAIEVDWRDFFPYLRWVPNKDWEVKIQRMVHRRREVMKTLIKERRKQIASGEDMDCYLAFLLSEGKTLTEEQLIMLVWETVIETSDTTLVTTEWAMYELAKNPKYQDHLYREIKEVCGQQKVSEELLPQLPYLNAVFHETLRKHSPVPIIPLRYAHENTQLGGYHIPAGSEIAINIYGCNHDKKEWDEPEEWKPDRFLAATVDTVDLFKTMAFGGGRRVCAGALQAMLISCTSIGRFIQEFEWRLEEGEDENEDTVQLTTHKREPMKALITPRERESM
ncbi:hypothetical protein ACLOJK_039961 [Asimina triloba]